MRIIYKYGLAIIKKNKILLCEPFAFKDLILPGGIKEGEESYCENLIRETREELGENAELDIKSLKYIGNFTDYAAGRENVLVEIELYIGTIKGGLKASSEIKDLIWFSPKDDKAILSAIIRNKILPFLIKQKYLSE